MVAGTLSLDPLNQVALLSLLAVKSVLLVALLVSESGSLVAGLDELAVGGVVGLAGLSQVVVLVLANFGEFGGSLLQFEQVVLGSLNLLISGGVLSFLVAIELTKAINLLLVTAALLLELLQLEVSGIDVLPESVGVVALGLSLALEPENLGLTA